MDCISFMIKIIFHWYQNNHSIDSWKPILDIDLSIRKSECIIEHRGKKRRVVCSTTVFVIEKPKGRGLNRDHTGNSIKW